MNKKIIVIMLLLLSVSGVSFAGGNMNKGTRLYEKSDFKGAVESFLKEQSKKPKDPVVNYNLASAYYKAGDFDKALETYETALNNTQDINFKSAVLYNMGNCAYRKGDNDLALQYYKSSLKLNSKDIQAKHNIEFLQSDKNKDNKNNKNDKKDKQQQNKQNDKKDQDKDKDKDKDKNNQQQDKQQQDKQQQGKDKYLLDYFDNQDKQNQNKQQNAEAVSNKRNGKTW